MFAITKVKLNYCLLRLPACLSSGRGVLRRWATTREHHVVVSVSSTTLQLLDDSNLQAVAPVGHEASQTKGRTRETAARATSEGLGAMDGWAGGAWVSLSITHARIMFQHEV